ncbi:MAG: IclR family transcriptional regulator [Rhodobacteraceae bacterium]|nr:IclR family transcriptional regulator [Paracoccaceae bacterium]
MSTVDKALGILDLFSEARPSLGLTEAARLSGRDKATVLRYLNALEKKGFLEQDPATRAYHLGPALVRLAVIRETTYPVSQAARMILGKLVESTGETAHLSHFAGESLSQIAVEETATHGTRVFIDMAEALSFHGTASGIAFLSACPPERARALLKGPLATHTPATPRDPETVLAQAALASRQGFAVCPGTFEADVCGIAAPVFGPSGEVCGAVAVATPSSRMSDAARSRISRAVRKAAAEISRHYGARMPVQGAAE